MIVLGVIGLVVVVGLVALVRRPRRVKGLRVAPAVVISTDAASLLAPRSRARRHRLDGRP